MIFCRRKLEEYDEGDGAAGGFTKSSATFSSKSACVAELMKMYQKLVEGK